MWLFTTIRFFSVVQKPGDTDLTVRARVRADLDALRAKYLPAMTAPVDHGGTDYPWRANVSHAGFAAALGELAGAIDYANFKDAVAARQGHDRARVYSKVWSAVTHLEALPAMVPPRSPRGRKVAYGGVVLDAEDRVLLREPRGHYGGYVWTFAKGRPDAGESPEAAALREVREETGVTARIRVEIDAWFEGDTTDTRFFLMDLVEDHGDLDAETAQVRWVTLEEARAMIAETRSATGRARDLAVLEAAERAVAARTD